MFLHLIGALFAMSLRPATTAAQPWSYTSTPTEYQNTVQYEVDDDAAFNTSTDPRVNLTMNCLAANGYGQWTMTTNVGSNANISGHDWNASPAGSFTNGQSGWFLLGNTLAKPAWNASSGAPDCQPPGVVSGGSFSGTLGSPKATANLNGAVRYVWPASDNLSFIVQGLSDIRTAGGGHSPEVDITVATLPVPVSTRQIVKNGIYSYPNATVQDHAVPTPLNHTIDNTEADSRDEFDIACDVYHLYIVWSSKTNTAIGVTEEVWATVIDMVDGTQVSGFPIKVSTTGSSGMRPTVACDPRNFGGTPKFDVAYIDNSSNAVVLQEFSGTTVVTGHS
ncbi:MAG: hypothetical protein JSS75_12385, partial [Bacteroidetes bacterium]|nr:hypothetical protein [Bacteroidota bacterium]